MDRNTGTGAPRRRIGWYLACALALAGAPLAGAAGAQSHPAPSLPKPAPQSPPSPAPPAGLEPTYPGTVPTISADEVKPGLRGYGLSVFSGREPERFEVEVVGVMRNTSPDLTYILARLTGQGLEKSGVPAGMSGSPVFFDGRLAGAVAFSWPFAQEAIAGITPISSMRRLAAFGTGGLSELPPLPAVPLADLLTGRVPNDLLTRSLEALRPRMALPGAVSGIEWSSSGFGARSQAFLQQALGSVTPAGKALPDGRKDLVLGGAVAAVLIDGDYQLAATGTVTDRFGDHVLAFGHPFLALGPVNLPMATAEIVIVLSSQQSSFKISNVGSIVGAFDQDRQVGIAGRIGAVATMVPVDVRIRGAGATRPREFHMRLADVQQLMPLLLGSTIVASLEATSYTSSPQSLDVQARFKLARHGDLLVRQSFDGDNVATGAASYLLAIAAYLAQNPFERVPILGIDVDINQSAQPRAATLVGVHAERTVVRPGERVGLNLDLVAYRGERFRHSLTLALPEDLPAGRYSLLIGDGASADAARLALEPAEPVSILQSLELLRTFHSKRELVVLGTYGGPGLSVAGEVMPLLPGSVRSLWSAAASGSAVALRTTIAQQQVETMPVPLEGLVRIDLEVRRRGPLGAVAGTAGADSDTKGTSGREDE